MKPTLYVNVPIWLNYEQLENVRHGIKESLPDYNILIVQDNSKKLPPVLQKYVDKAVIKCTGKPL